MPEFETPGSSEREKELSYLERALKDAEEALVTAIDRNWDGRPRDEDEKARARQAIEEFKERIVKKLEALK